MSSSPLPVHTERLLLRGGRADDADALLGYYGDPHVVRYLLHDVLDRAGVEQRLARFAERLSPTESGDVLSLVIEHEGRAVGDLMLRLAAGEPPSTAEVGWVLDPAYAGRGLATEATRALIGLAFGHYGLHRVFAHLDPRNHTSVRLCERLGMTKEGHLRRDFLSKGEWTDTAVYGLLAEEWHH